MAGEKSAHTIATGTTSASVVRAAVLTNTSGSGNCNQNATGAPVAGLVTKWQRRSHPHGEAGLIRSERMGASLQLSDKPCKRCASAILVAVTDQKSTRLNYS